MKSFEKYLRDSAVTTELIDNFLDPHTPSWAQFDPVTGYILGNSMPHDGLDNAWTISTVQPQGMRTSFLYADAPCRINTYGNSFTQCHQVSDGETWQEYLAAHFGEPIRNFGMGGFGVYQSYRRMLSIEQSDLEAKNVLLYVWGDDHCRNIMRCRHAVTYPHWDSQNGAAFHGNFWAHVEIDLTTGAFVEHENLLDTPEKLYKMTDPDFMVDALHDDLMVQLYAIDSIDPDSIDRAPLNTLADVLQVPRIDFSSHETMSISAMHLRNHYGFAATQFILDKTAEFCKNKNKNLLIILLCPLAMMELLRGEPRYDQPVANFVQQRGYNYFDMNLIHQKDFKLFNMTVEEYVDYYFIGHYSPKGNHFFAYALKDKLLEILDPPPVTYSQTDSHAVSFKGYLPGYVNQ